jgi:L-threonylcarbamoyladenylate synthase
VDVDPVALALRALRAGAVVGVPTDTVYGLAAILEPIALGRVFEAKGRPGDLALPVLVDGLEQVRSIATSFPPVAAHLGEVFWPGPLTLVVPAKRAIGKMIGGNGRTVGVRWPNHPLLETFCNELGPLAVTSANRHGEPPLTSAEAVRGAFEAELVSLVIDGGHCAGEPSTVVDCTARVPRCVREGALSWSEIEARLL